jgi:hypothetical protein
MNIEEGVKEIEKIKEMFIHLKNYGWINDIKKEIDVDKAIESIETLLTAYEKEKEKNKKAKEFIQENSHEFNCKRDDLIELEFDNNTNATDLIDILDGNW